MAGREGFNDVCATDRRSHHKLTPGAWIASGRLTLELDLDEDGRTLAFEDMLPWERRSFLLTAQHHAR